MRKALVPLVLSVGLIALAIPAGAQADTVVGQTAPSSDCSSTESYGQVQTSKPQPAAAKRQATMASVARRRRIPQTL